MKVYNLKIVDVFLELLEENNQTFISDIDDFEEKINTRAPHMLDECYLIVRSIRCGLYDMLLFVKNIDTRTLIDLLMKNNGFQKDEAVFIIGVMRKVLNNTLVQMNILNFDDIKDRILQGQSLFQMKMIALAYFDGEGVPQDYEEAYKIFSYLYEKGDYEVFGYLGYMLENGLGVEEDIKKAIDFYERGVLNQDDKCLYHLGMCYLNGKGCVKDVAIAKLYLSQSNDIEAIMQLAKIYEDEGLAGEAFHCYFKAARRYNIDAMYKTGMAYFDGKGIKRNISGAMRFLAESAYLMQKESICQVGYMLIKGIGFDEDVSKGLDFIRFSANLGCMNAYVLLAKFYEFGQYVDKDIQLSIHYYQKAIEINEDVSLKNKVVRMQEDENL